MKEQQRHSCSCPVCGRRRNAIEEELEMLYDAYYEELESYAEKEGTLTLGLQGGMLSVADDLMKNEGKKFLEMMEKLAERRMRRQMEKEQHPRVQNFEDDDYDEELELDDELTEEQRLEEGKRMFQMFAAKMFEQRVLTAYREKVALEKQRLLIEAEEEKERQEQLRKESRQRRREQKKLKRKKLREKQEKERQLKLLLQKEKEEEQRKKAEAQRKAAQKRKKEERARKEELLRKQQEDYKLQQQKLREQKAAQKRAASNEQKPKTNENANNNNKTNVLNKPKKKRNRRRKRNRNQKLEKYIPGMSPMEETPVQKSPVKNQPIVNNNTNTVNTSTEEIGETYNGTTYYNSEYTPPAESLMYIGDKQLPIPDSWRGEEFEDQQRQEEHESDIDADISDLLDNIHSIITPTSKEFKSTTPPLKQEDRTDDYLNDIWAYDHPSYSSRQFYNPIPLTSQFTENQGISPLLSPVLPSDGNLNLASLAMDIRIYIAFEALRHRVLMYMNGEEHKEFWPMPFDIWMKLMLVADSGLDLSVIDNIEEFMETMEKEGYIRIKDGCSSIENVTKRSCTCFACYSNFADIIILPCCHTLCSQCLKQSKGTRKCEFCSVNIEKYMPIPNQGKNRQISGPINAHQGWNPLNDNFSFSMSNPEYYYGATSFSSLWDRSSLFAGGINLYG
eukprot:TRINITY_DN4980_c0_g1_i1.p1 TRINITY_DN4980_c0_g1~~TRINITY_DN4980_c0_g1_i1.p1  ORF type:complete len:675 (-),score=203.95 TRINITY_DN4980_c0_g1_i1:1082-3106(-)